MRYRAKRQAEQQQSMTCKYCSAQYIIDDLKAQIITLQTTNQELWKMCQSRGTANDKRICKYEKHSQLQRERIGELETQVSDLIKLVKH